MLKSLRLRIPASDTKWIFSHQFVVKNSVCLKKTESKLKQAGNGPFKKGNVVIIENKD